MLRFPRTALFVLLLALSLSGCRSQARVLSLDLHATEKDVLVFSVELEGPLDPEGYLEWTREDLAQSAGSLSNPFYSAPIYELIYSFHSTNLQLATVRYRRTEGDAGTLEHHRTIVYSVPNYGRNSR